MVLMAQLARTERMVLQVPTLEVFGLLVVKVQRELTVAVALVAEVEAAVVARFVLFVITVLEMVELAAVAAVKAELQVQVA